MDKTTQFDIDPDLPAYYRDLIRDGKGQILPESESESEIIVAKDDAEILTDGGRPTLTGTGGNGNEIKTEEVRAFRLRTKLSSEETIRKAYEEIVEKTEITEDALEIVERRVGVDPR